MGTPTARIDGEVLEAIRTGSLNEAQTRAFAHQSPEVIIFTLLALAKQV